MLHTFLFFFFFNDTATTEIYTLSLHDALPISRCSREDAHAQCSFERGQRHCRGSKSVRRRSRSLSEGIAPRSEEHTSELQSPCNLVCRLLLEKKKKHYITIIV